MMSQGGREAQSNFLSNPESQYTRGSHQRGNVRRDTQCVLPHFMHWAGKGKKKVSLISVAGCILSSLTA